MSKTLIEYGNWAWNPIIGCSGAGCPTKDVCWARKINDRFKFIDDFSKPQITNNYYDAPKNAKRILVCYLSDIMRPEIKSEWIRNIINTCKIHPLQNFIFLTKNPSRYLKFEFPANCWLGATVNYQKDWDRCVFLARKKKNITFVSLEPLLEEPLDYIYLTDWIIVGAQTNPYIPPKREWIDQIVKDTQYLGIPLFLKDNLEKVYPDYKKYRQYPSRKMGVKFILRKTIITNKEVKC